MSEIDRIKSDLKANVLDQVGMERRFNWNRLTVTMFGLVGVGLSVYTSNMAAGVYAASTVIFSGLYFKADNDRTLHQALGKQLLRRVVQLMGKTNPDIAEFFKHNISEDDDTQRQTRH